MYKNLLGLVVGLFLGLAMSGPARAAAIDTLASHAILVDAGTGTVLLDKNANEKMPTSSMSKTMSVYIVFEALKKGTLHLNDSFTVSEKAWRMEGSKMFIKVGDSVKVEDLIRGVVIQSGNDATVALAEGISGSEQAFVDVMNARAQELGMTNSHFMNATGWPDPEHYSTSRDLALLAYRLITDFPEYYHYFSEKEFTYNKIKQHNRDPLLTRLPGADGLKTGHTEIAGYGLIGSAKRGARRLILVMNGLVDDKARGDEGVRLMEWGFRNFESRTIIAKDEKIDLAKVWMGVDDAVPLIAEKDVQVVLPVTNRNGLKVTLSYMSPLKAPIQKGDVVGKLNVFVPDQQPVDINVLAAADVKRQGLLKRVKTRFQYLVMGSY